jgi:hypothetical protein
LLRQPSKHGDPTITEAIYRDHTGTLPLGDKMPTIENRGSA